MLTNNIILLQNNNGYVLFDYVEDILYAYGWIRSDTEYVVISFVAAEHGYGPLIHDIIMMDNFPLFIRCDNDLTQDEIAIWNFYFNKRKDIKKYKITNKKILNILKEYNNESLLYSYQQEPKKWFIDLKDRSKNVIFDLKINVSEIVNDGECFFDEKYYTN